MVIILVFVYAFIVWTAILSFTNSTILPRYSFVGWTQYIKLWSIPNWYTAIKNLFIFTPLYISISVVIGLSLAIFLDQKIRIEGVIRPIYLYPMALSFIVSGTAWKWFLNPGTGLENAMHNFGWESFTFDWIINSDKAIYTVVIAAVWQSSGFVMAIFLSGLRGVNDEVVKSAKIDGAGFFNVYRYVIIPQLKPAFASAVIILLHLAIKSYDLVIALTNAGPGNSTEMPATFMYSYTFARSQMAIGSASAVVMLLTIASIFVPYIYSEVKNSA
ncbi:MAG: sugar ABC transporter permease [SAR324 cluster bacterium]|nr:sugar ABC transporter permease [SAR324 cluster bacterium]